MINLEAFCLALFALIVCNGAVCIDGMEKHGMALLTLIVWDGVSYIESME